MASYRLQIVTILVIFLLFFVFAIGKLYYSSIFPLRTELFIIKIAHAYATNNLRVNKTMY